jgi:hypothetical protein
MDEEVREHGARGLSEADALRMWFSVRWMEGGKLVRSTRYSASGSAAQAV